ncbi:MAG: ABC transporter ATP-binding protein [Acidimicrobiia bacterium]|nr:ABC transporter ATP-binding protein [Acidimicrobiia bacterium]
MLFAVSVVALSRAIAWVTDELIVPGLDGDGVTDSQLVTGFLIILVIAMVRGAGAVVRRYYLAMAEYRTGGTWRGQLFDQYLKQPLSFHRSIPTGQLLAHADNDLVVAGIVLKPLAFAVATVVLAFLAIVSLALVHPLFGLVAVVLLPILMTINQLYSTRVAGPAAEVQQAVASVTNVAHESFDGIMVIKTLGRTDDEVDRMRSASADLRAKRLQVGRLRAVFEPLLETLPSIGVVVLLLIGAGLVDEGSVSVGEVVGAMSLFSVLSLPIRIVGFFLQSMPASVVALERIDKVLDLPLPEAHGGSVRELPDGPLELSFDDVSFSHGEHVVIDSLNLRVAAGETVALVGATGSGKTTLIELAAGLIPPSSGSISLGGVGHDDLLPQARAERLGVVFQETFLFAESIAENITMGEAATSEQIAVAARTSNAVDFIEATPEGYDTIVGERGATLSGGQKQRVALARALFRNPSLLLLDDATSALDPTVEAEILRGLDGGSMTILMVAHRLSTIALADRVAFLEDGAVRALGTHEELLVLEGYRTLVQAYEEA